MPSSGTDIRGSPRNPTNLASKPISEPQEPHDGSPERYARDYAYRQGRVGAATVGDQWPDFDAIAAQVKSKI